MNDLRAGLTYACPERTHIWREGLKRLPNAEKSRNKLFVLPDATINALIDQGYARDAKLGLFFEVLKERHAAGAGGAIEGLPSGHASGDAEIAGPKSAKGGGQNRSEKKRETYSQPISAGLAKKLKRAAKGRAEDDRLLLRADGEPWNEANVNADYRTAFAGIVKALGLNPKISAYCFRHSSIVASS